jgi:hypothetical protein
MSLYYKMACKIICSEFDEDRGIKLNSEHLVKIIHETSPKFLFFGAALDASTNRASSCTGKKREYRNPRTEL